MAVAAVDRLGRVVGVGRTADRRRSRAVASGSAADIRIGALSGILFVLRTGIAWRRLPEELGCGSGITCWRRLGDWQQAGVWKRLHRLLLAELQAAGEIDWSRAVVDASYIQAKKIA